jgi:hypothetical protein
MIIKSKEEFRSLEPSPSIPLTLYGKSSLEQNVNS